MPSIPSLSEFIKCNNLSSCFQELYNFLFALFILLAFLSFLYGAFLYLLSAGGVYDKEKGKNKMKNSIIALLVALIIPIILNMINPGIFRSELKVPQVEVTLFEYQGFGSGYIEPPPGSTHITGFYGKFTGFGYDSHIVLLTGYQDGKFLVNDPGPLDVKEISAKEASGHIVSMTAIRCLR
jgi:hypothetical protein